MTEDKGASFSFFRDKALPYVESWSVSLRDTGVRPALISPGLFIASSRPRSLARSEVFSRGRHVTYERGNTLELHGPQEYFRVVRTSPIEAGVIVFEPAYVVDIFPELQADRVTFERMETGDASPSSAFWQACDLLMSGGDLLERHVALVNLLGCLRHDLVGGPTTPARVPSCWKRIAAARDLVQDRYGERLSLADIAKAVGLSQFHLHRMFTEAMGVPIDAYRRHVRVNRALAMLRHGATLADAATSVGFVDQAHFTKTLRAQMGFTPGAYRAGFRSR